MNTSRHTNLFKETSMTQPSLDIPRCVMLRIEHSRIVHARIRAGSYGLITVGVAVAFIPSVGYFLDGITQSGFLEYSALIITDGAYIASSWKELAYSLLESTPILASATTVALILIFTISAKRSVSSISSLSAFRNHRLTA